MEYKVKTVTIVTSQHSSLTAL